MLRTIYNSQNSQTKQKEQGLLGEAEREKMVGRRSDWRGTDLGIITKLRILHDKNNYKSQGHVMICCLNLIQNVEQVINESEPRIKLMHKYPHGVCSTQSAG